LKNPSIGNVFVVSDFSASGNNSKSGVPDSVKVVGFEFSNDVDIFLSNSFVG
jgi:hypothetical protein